LGSGLCADIGVLGFVCHRHRAADHVDHGTETPTKQGWHDLAATAGDDQGAGTRASGAAGSGGRVPYSRSSRLSSVMALSSCSRMAPARRCRHVMEAGSPTALRAVLCHLAN
jgi:hypothetical protein